MKLCEIEAASKALIPLTNFIYIYDPGQNLFNNQHNKAHNVDLAQLVKLSYVSSVIGLTYDRESVRLKST